MSLTDPNGGLSAADVAAVMNGGGRGGWGGGFGDGNGAWWLIILFLFAMGRGGFGGGYGSGGGGGLPFAMGVPAQAADVQRGFDQSATIGALGNLQTQIGAGFADAAVARCAGDAGITAAITNGQYATAQAITGAKDTIAQTLNANQLANLQSQNSLAMALQNCCCENRAGLADLKYTVATEACADRAAVTNGLQALTAQNNANTNAITSEIRNGIQAIKDDLCQDRLDAANRQIAQLQTQLNMANLAASQTAQTAALIQDNNAQTAALIQRIAPYPSPSYNVPNPYTGCCGGYNNGCGV